MQFLRAMKCFDSITARSNICQSELVVTVGRTYLSSIDVHLSTIVVESIVYDDHVDGVYRSKIQRPPIVFGCFGLSA